MVRVGGDPYGSGDGGGGDDGKGEGDKNGNKERPTTPSPITEVGDSNESSAEFTPVLISSFLVSRFQQEVGDPPGELVLPSTSAPRAPSSSDDNVDAAPVVLEAQSAADAMPDEDSTLLGATAAAPASPQPQNRRQPTPAEAQRYEEVARQLNEVARQIETEYSNELDDLVDSLNLVAEVAYDAFAAVARTIIAKGITWSRVLVLILFGWRVMKKVYLTWSTSGVLQRILDYILKFITDYVLAWVCDHGGWMNLLRNPPTTPSPDGPAAALQPFLPDAATNVLGQLTVEHALGAAALGACAVLAYLFWSKRN